MSAPNELVDALVGEAQKYGGFDFTQTLLRVGGIESFDPFESCRIDLLSGAAVSKPRDTYCRWSHHDDFLRFLWNLVESSQKRPFNSHALHDLTGSVPYGDKNRVTSHKVARVVGRLADSQHEALASLVADCFPDHLLIACGDREAEDATFREAVEKLAQLYQTLLAASDRERLQFGTANTLVRWPRFEVLELLANDTSGLYGYRVYFSNGSYAEFSRSG
jgi:hypothetical protein